MARLAYQQLDQMHNLIKLIIQDIEGTFGERTITSIHRPGDSGVHGTFPARGTDISDEGNTKEAEAIAAYINSKWKYDPKRPHLKCCLYHKNRGSSGKHLHIQVHQNTRRV